MATGRGRSEQLGFHIEHVNSFNPIFRTIRSYADLAIKADPRAANLD